MKTLVRFDHYTISHRGQTPEETLEFARTHGLDGVQFVEPSQIDTGLALGQMERFRLLTESMGLYLEVGLPSPNPVRRSRELGRTGAASEHRSERMSDLVAY